MRVIPFDTSRFRTKQEIHKVLAACDFYINHKELRLPAADLEKWCDTERTMKTKLLIGAYKE